MVHCSLSVYCPVLWSPCVLARSPGGRLVFDTHSAASRAVNCWVCPSTRVTNMRVSTIRIVALPLVPLSADFPRELNRVSRLGWGHILYRSFQIPQSTLDVPFIDIPLAAILCVVGRSQTHLTPWWVSRGCRKAPSINGGVNH